ncbi:MAG: GNAT family N-acetyltransferase [Promethearchaeota archaeon]
MEKINPKSLLIKECPKEDLLVFNQIICDAFIDKFPVIFKGLNREEYINLMKEIHESVYDLVERRNEFLVYLKEEGGNLRPIAGFRLIFPGLKPEPKGPPWKVLRSHLSLWKAFRDGFLLELLTQDLGKLKEKDILYIDAIGVNEEYRGRGVGWHILSFIENLARTDERLLKSENPVSKLALHVVNRNPRAKKLYERFGFEAIKKDKVIFAKRLFDIKFFYFMLKKLN